MGFVEDPPDLGTETQGVGQRLLLPILGKVLPYLGRLVKHGNSI